MTVTEVDVGTMLLLKDVEEVLGTLISFGGLDFGGFSREVSGGRARVGKRPAVVVEQL